MKSYFDTHDVLAIIQTIYSPGKIQRFFFFFFFIDSKVHPLSDLGTLDVEGYDRRPFLCIGVEDNGLEQIKIVVISQRICSIKMSCRWNTEGMRVVCYYLNVMACSCGGTK